ncbi:MAG: peptide chain release factor H [Clostridia bacterium]|nr:peptide chain release factor H [Clostridia bacterium]
MLIQLSSGQGPAECELAVTKLYESLSKEYDDIELIDSHKSKTTGCCTSILLHTDNDLSKFEGTVLWICQSPYRPHHKRKNWYVDVSIIAEIDNENIGNGNICNEQDIKVERFHCGGNGGQNVNKVETGIRLIHIPTGIAVTCTTERSQLQNRHKALQKLKLILVAQRATSEAQQRSDAWMEHKRIIRGNPIRTYEGMRFTLRSKK